jgi:hypothetical protein
LQIFLSRRRGTKKKKKPHTTLSFCVSLARTTDLDSDLSLSLSLSRFSVILCDLVGVCQPGSKSRRRLV